MVDLMDHLFLHIELGDRRFKYLVTFSIQVYGGGETSINILKKERKKKNCSISTVWKQCIKQSYGCLLIIVQFKYLIHAYMDGKEKEKSFCQSG